MNKINEEYFKQMEESLEWFYSELVRTGKIKPRKFVYVEKTAVPLSFKRT